MSLGADTEGFTELAMGDQGQRAQPMQMGMAHPHQDQHMMAEFYQFPVEDEVKSAELGRPFFEDVVYVRVKQPGNNNSVIERPIRFGATPKHDNHRFAHQYALFKQNETQVMTGMPLSQWPGVTVAQVKNLNFANIQTVEQLADIADSQLTGLMGGNGLKQKAKDWLANADDGKIVTQLRAELIERDNRLAANDEAMTEMMTRLTALEAGPAKNKRKAATDG